MIREYLNELEEILGNYRVEHPKTICGSAKKLSIEQLQELIKKKEAPSYEINMEIMKE